MDDDPELFPPTDWTVEVRCPVRRLRNDSTTPVEVLSAMAMAPDEWADLGSDDRDAIMVFHFKDRTAALAALDRMRGMFRPNNAGDAKVTYSLKFTGRA